MTPLLLVLALMGASPRPADAALWEAAFALNDPAEAPRAVALLTKAGPAGTDVLLKLARAGGESAALNAATLDMRCPMGVAGDGMQQQMMMMRSRNPEPTQIAARMLSTRMKEDAALRERLLTSRSSFERRFALAHLAADPKTLVATLPRLSREKDPLVLTLAARALQCLHFMPAARRTVDAQALQAVQTQLNKQLEGLVPQDRCDSAEGITGEMREGLRQGLWRITGWSSGSRELIINVDTGRGVFLRLTPPCALALYDVLAQRDVYLHGLLMPLSTSPELEKKTRQEAAQRAVRDLDRYPEDERNRLAAELVNAGHPVSRDISLKEDGFAEEVALEAAARRQQAGAAAAIETYVFCRGMSGGSSVSLLGFVGTPRAAETAWELASRCPRARPPATAALLRLKDPRALELLGPTLDQPFYDQTLKRAVLESYSPALGEKLRALKAANPDSQGAREAASLLEQLKDAGVTVP